MVALIIQLTVDCEMKIKQTIRERRRESSESHGKALVNSSLENKSYRGKGDEGH